MIIGPGPVENRLFSFQNIGSKSMTMMPLQTVDTLLL